MGCMLVSDLSNSAGLKHSLQLCLQLVVQQNPQQIEIMKYGSNSRPQTSQKRSMWGYMQLFATVLDLTCGAA